MNINIRLAQQSSNELCELAFESAPIKITVTYL